MIQYDMKIFIMWKKSVEYTQLVSKLLNIKNLKINEWIRAKTVEQKQKNGQKLHEISAIVRVWAV